MLRTSLTPFKPIVLACALSWLAPPWLQPRPSRARSITSEPVPVQVGADDALWWGDGVAAREGGVSFGISVATAGDRAGRQPKAESLARLIVQRLARTQG